MQATSVTAIHDGIQYAACSRRNQQKENQSYKRSGPLQHDRLVRLNPIFLQLGETVKTFPLGSRAGCIATLE